MKQDNHTTSIVSRTTPSDVCRWGQALLRLHARIAPRFARPEPHRRALAFLQGILSEISRKNGWQLAEHAGEARPDGMQRLLSQAVWDSDGVRDDLRSYVLEQLGDEAAILVIDETSFPKRGQHSAGVGLQYCGTTGQVENCQVGVFLSYVTSRGHSLIDRELYLPLDWCEDRDRCRAASIPESVRFQTKPELAGQMIERLWKAAVPISWVVADTVYGGNLDLRRWLQAHGYPYVMAVACNEPVGFQTPTGRRREEAALVEAFVLQDGDWQRLSMSEGTKGPRLFDWAIVPVLHQWEDDGRHWLLIRRCVDDPSQKTYYFVFAPQGTTLPEMVKAIGARWHVEENFENGKDLGMDHYEVRSFIGWYRHITLVLLALAYLAGICATERFSTVPPPPSESVTRPPALPLTIPEVRHLLARLIWPSSSSTHRVLGCRVVASLPPKRGELLPHQTSFEGRLILADSYSLGFALARDHFLDFSEISWKCRSSWKSVHVLSPICSFLERSSERMTLLPVADGARLLGIHPKTLHHWLKEANLLLVTHPTDARIKCVTEEHLQQVASLHGRPLQAFRPLDAASPSLVPSQVSVPHAPENEAESPSTACSFLTTQGSEADLLQRLSGLETKIATLQEQFAQLTLALLQERERSVEHRLTTLESLMHPLVGRQLSALPTPGAEQEPPCPRRAPRPLHPVEQLARSRMPPLIEYSAPGIYVIISSQEGEVYLEPNSRAWFDWLATLSSFRFVGPTGRFTGHRGYKDGQQTRYWSASRCVRRHTYKHYLGMTESLTIANLERTAARLQSDIDAR